jgi:radical SAM protein with 4Fe4S-binding SPASM domain
VPFCGAAGGWQASPLNLQTGRSSEGDFRNLLHLRTPFKLTVCFTERCNLKCRFCYCDCGRSLPDTELGGRSWIELLTKLITEGIISLYFEGGEPFLRPDFLEVLQACGRRAYCAVRTHATEMDIVLARRCREANLAEVFVDLWGARARTHDALTGVPGSFDCTLKGLAALQSASYELRTLIVLNRYNVQELQEYVDFVYDLGVRTVGILRLYPLGRAKRLWSELALSLDEQMSALRALRPRPQMRIMQSWHPNNPNCCWHMAAINARGDSIGCAYLREYVNYGNIRHMPFLKTWDHPLYRKLRSGNVTKSCSTCSRSQGSHGGCRATAYAFTGRFDAPDPFDETINSGVDVRELPSWLLQEKPEPPAATGT